MKIGYLLGSAATVLAASLLFFGCGGNGGDESAGGGSAEEQHAGAQSEKAIENTPMAMEEGGETMTDHADWATIAEKLGVDLGDLVEHESGMSWIVRQEGSGAVPEKGQTIKAHYTGYLLDGTKFDSSVDRGQPFTTPIGVQRVIQGWDIAFTDMKVGEKRVLFIPPELGYGSRGAGGIIPPNATLVFDVELLDIVG